MQSPVPLFFSLRLRTQVISVPHRWLQSVLTFIPKSPTPFILPCLVAILMSFQQDLYSHSVSYIKLNPEIISLPITTTTPSSPTLRIRVVNKETSLPVVGATIRVRNTTIGAVTNSNGIATLKKLPIGILSIMISSVGYSPEFDTIAVAENGISSSKIKNGEMLIGLIESAFATSDVVVTATRNEQLYDDAPVKVSVLTDRIFTATQSATALEGLQFQPGLRVENACQNCGMSGGPRLNGLSGAYSLILIDSRPVFSSLNAVYGLEQFPASMIERVEIVRGGGSALFGAHAVGGVVNIITKEPTENALIATSTLDLIAGRTPDRRHSLSASLVNNDESAGGQLTLLNRQREFYDANGDGFSEITRLQNLSLASKWFYKTSSKGKLTATLNYLTDKRRGGNLFDLAPELTDITEMIHHQVVNSSLSFEQYLGQGADKISVYASATNTNRQSYYGANRDSNAYGTTFNTIAVGGVQYSSVISLQSLGSSLGLAPIGLDSLGDAVLTTGVEIQHDNIDDRMTGYNRYIKQKATLSSWYGQMDWRISSVVSLLAGVRLDKHSLLPTTQINPRLNLHLRLAKDLTLRTTYSTGFRPPAVFDEDLHISLVGGEAQLIRLAPGLNAERSQSISSSIDYSNINAVIPYSISLDGFYTRINGIFTLVDGGVDSAGNRLLTKQNASSATVAGGGIELKLFPIRTLEIQSGVTLQTAFRSESYQWGNTPESTTDILLRTPNFYGYATVIYTPSHVFDISLSGVYTGSMTVPHFAGYITEDRLVETPSFLDATIRASLEVFHSPDIRLNASIINVFNAYQRDFDKGILRDAGFVYGPLRPRTVSFGFSVEL
jgi:outer membrane receptor for ferrienterochelin and colicins